MRIKIYTLGCKVNQFESQAMAEALQTQGHTVVGPKDDFDIFIINTCAVTSKACYQARQAIRKALNKNPDARVIATGCYTQIDPWGLIESIDTNICVIGNDQKEMLLNLKLSSMDCLEIFVGDIFKKKTISKFTLSKPQGRTRAYLRIQDGCDAFCSYCIVPYARGPSRSLSIDKIIEQAQKYVDSGVKEIVVTGIHVGFYGKDLGMDDGLVKAIDELTRRFPECRFRLSSIEPNELKDEILDLCAERENFCKHFHIPLQSGSSRVLKAMGRKYKPELFVERTHTIRERFPDASIGTDCLVGFPGEYISDFEQTAKIIEATPVTYVHAFPFSKRPGTRAYGLKETVNKKEKDRRSKIIRDIGKRKKEEFYRNHLGKYLNCLVEKVDLKKGKVTGRTQNYLLIEAVFDPQKTDIHSNNEVKVLTKDYVNESLIGVVLA